MRSLRAIQGDFSGVGGGAQRRVAQQIAENAIHWRKSTFFRGVPQLMANARFSKRPYRSAQSAPDCVHKIFPWTIPQFSRAGQCELATDAGLDKRYARDQACFLTGNLDDMS